MKTGMVKWLIVERKDYDKKGNLKDEVRSAIRRLKLVFCRAENGKLIIVKSDVGISPKKSVNRGVK